jgi:HEAT repeat protein
VANTPPVRPDWLEACGKLADSADLSVRAQESATALSNLARELRKVTDPALMESAMAVGRMLAGPEVVQVLLDAALQPWTDSATLAGALRFRGASVVGAVLGRLHAARDRSARRSYFQLGVALTAFPELRESLIGSLEAALYDRRSEVVRNAIALLAATGVPLPVESHRDLATSSDIQVRLAFAQVAGRWKPSPEVRDLLCVLLGDPHPGIRLAAANALRNYNGPEVGKALERCVATEKDPETRAVCEGAMKRYKEAAERARGDGGRPAPV